jgi:hypothetical protein
MVPISEAARRNAKCKPQAGSSSKQLKGSLLECVSIGGEVLWKYFGKLLHPRQKEVPSSIVPEADLASERRILAHIQATFPDHNIIAGESSVFGTSLCAHKSALKGGALVQLPSFTH